MFRKHLHRHRNDADSSTANRNHRADYAAANGRPSREVVIVPLPYVSSNNEVGAGHTKTDMGQPPSERQGMW